MVEASLNDIREIERRILPDQYVFDSDQNNVLLSNKSANIVACPGSGKTTVLIAKIAILLKKIKSSSESKGICIITHTNVGVDEIKNRLRDLGIESIEYPHFIGTIQEFFNHFFAKKAYASLFKNKKRIIFLEEDEYVSYFIRAFEKFKPSFYNAPPPVRTMKQCFINFDNQNQPYLTNFLSQNKEYRTSMINTLLYLMKRGILRHSESLSLTDWYINGLNEEFRDALSQRFSHFFMDETQDTSMYQLKLVDQLIDGEKIIFQKFGDPYQALYNLYNGEDDAWDPDDEDKLEISKSNRFGEALAKVLRTTCVKEYLQLKGNSNVTSFSPVLLVYTNATQENVIEKFAEIVSTLYEKNTRFRDSTKSIYAVCQHHDEINKYHKNYMRKKKEPHQSLVSQCLEILQQMIAKYFRNDPNKHNYSYAQFEEELYEFDEELLNDFRDELANWIKTIMNTNGNLESLEEEISSYLEYILKHAFAEKVDNQTITKNIKFAERAFKKVFNREKKYETSKLNEVVSNGIKVNLDSVHAVKGETHKATLMLESNRQINENPPTKDITRVFEFLTGNFNQHISSSREVKNALKLSYVAISRATHLAAVAVKKENLENYERQKQVAIDSGWRVIDV